MAINHFSGPLLLLPNFNHGLLRHCSLHNLNLGLAATANGSSLLLGQTHFVALKGIYMMFKSDRSSISQSKPRLLLADLNFFGDANALTMNQRLAVAYRDFKIWCKEKRVKCSQPMFRESLDFWRMI